MKGAPPAHRTVLVLVAMAIAAGCGTSPGHGATPVPPSSTGPAPSSTTASPPAADWTTYGGSTARTAADTAEADLRAAPVRAWTSPRLDGAVYGEPIIAGGQVLVATESDTVYGLSAATGAVAWSDHLGAAVPAGAMACGDISPTVGVTSTMTVDPATGLLFASAALWNGRAVTHELFAIDLKTHAVRWSRDLDQPGWSPAAQLQRAGLALDGGTVLVGFGGNYGDCGTYHGWVIGAPEDGTGSLSVYKVPAANEGAIWAPAGPAVDAAGDVFVATGNGAAVPGQAFDHGNTVIELSSSLSEKQYWAPSNWAQLSENDLDLGSTSPVVLGDDQLFVVGKGGTGYLLHASSLGGVGGPASSVRLCNSRGATAYGGSRLYVVCPDAGTIDQVLVGSGSLQRGWTWESPGGGASSPTLARGALWVIGPGSPTLYGVDPASGTTRWALPLDTGTPATFAGVSAGEGLLVVGGAAAVEAFR